MAEALTGGPMTADPITADPIKVPHGFFTRRGGVSGGAYASLNCSLSSQDDPGNVLQNRALAARAIGAEPEHLLGLTQVHGTHVVTVNAPWPPGHGARADAMVTDRPGLALGIVTADCAPVLFADSQGGIVGAAHAGWRGAVAGVLEATIAAMTTLGATAARITAAIGPCIAQAVRPGRLLRRPTARRRGRARNRDRIRHHGRGGPLLQPSQANARESRPDRPPDLRHQAGVIDAPK
jgi:hypothetical protein